MKNFITKFKSFLGLDFFTSELDQFLKKFDATHTERSAAQRAEIKKYDAIYQQRDNMSKDVATKKLWDNF